MELEVHGVKIGDRFISSKHRKSKRVSTVIDFIERRSLVTGAVVGIECIAQYEFMGQIMNIEVSIASVRINRVTEPVK